MKSNAHHEPARSSGRCALSKDEKLAVISPTILWRRKLEPRGAVGTWLTLDKSCHTNSKLQPHVIDATIAGVVLHTTVT